MKEKEEEMGFMNINITPKNCPKCGANIRKYDNGKYGDGEEIHYECGYTLIKFKRDGTVDEKYPCRKTKEWKKLEESRLKQLKKVVEFVEKEVYDISVKRDILDRLSHVKYQITDWWCN